MHVSFITDLLQRLNNGEKVLVAEGYMFEFNRRGYLKSGSMVPEVVIEHPHLVQNMHEEFVHAGSDVVLAFTVSIWNITIKNSLKIINNLNRP